MHIKPVQISPEHPLLQEHAQYVNLLKNIKNFVSSG
jgi:chitinase